MIRKLLMLIHCIRQLGLRVGVMYFSCYLKALKRPEFVLDWAEACEKNARKLEFFNPNDPMAEAGRSWAAELRKCYAKIQNFENTSET